MADAYGAVVSNEFEVKDAAAFRQFFSLCRFGDEIELWQEGGRFKFGGYEMYPQAYPMLSDEHPDYDQEADDNEWDLEAFAAEMRKHLVEGQVLDVGAACHEKLRYVNWSHLRVSWDPAVPPQYDIYSVG